MTKPPSSPKLADGNKLAAELRAKRDDAIDDSGTCGICEDEASDGPYMSAWDILALERAEWAVKEAHYKVQDAAAKGALLDVQHKLQCAQLAEAYRTSDREQRDANGAHRKLAAEIARKYDLDWATHSYNSETGEVSET